MRIAILTSNTGVEEVELTSPRDAAVQRGWQVEHLASTSGPVQTMEHDVDKDAFNATIAEVFGAR